MRGPCVSRELNRCLVSFARYEGSQQCGPVRLRSMAPPSGKAIRAPPGRCFKVGTMRVRRLVTNIFDYAPMRPWPAGGQESPRDTQNELPTHNLNAVRKRAKQRFELRRRPAAPSASS
jgi:hypothetical protein